MLAGPRVFLPAFGQRTIVTGERCILLLVTISFSFHGLSRRIHIWLLFNWKFNNSKHNLFTHLAPDKPNNINNQRGWNSSIHGCIVCILIRENDVEFCVCLNIVYIYEISMFVYPTEKCLQYIIIVWWKRQPVKFNLSFCTRIDFVYFMCHAAPINTNTMVRRNGVISGHKVRILVVDNHQVVCML